MVSDSITLNGSPASAIKDFGKKKRANRSAKLKQCKLDARREQWLSQVKSRDEKEVTGTCVSQLMTAALEKDQKSHPFEYREEIKGKGNRGKEGLVVRSEEDDHDNSSFSDSFFNSPTGSSILGETDCRNNYLGLSSSSSCSGSRSGCCSGSITEEEDGIRADDDCLDDWEAVADALAEEEDEPKQEIQDSQAESVADQETLQGINQNSGPCGEMSRKGYERTRSARLVPRNNQAWRADDIFRPLSLPSVSKQRSFAIVDRHHNNGDNDSWARVAMTNLPSLCPICCEELDCTDTSFLPCLCGYRLCLFCYKRIMEEDGRCPGCRKAYERNPTELQSNLHGHGRGLNLRLTRSDRMTYKS